MYKKLLEKAVRARENAYAPYSGFKVGAALLTKDGKVFTGCNVENASYPACNCAERTAIFKAVSEGYQKFAALAIVGGSMRGGVLLDECAPCGVCRQTMAEFADDDFVVVLGTPKAYKVYRFSELYPFAFDKNDL